MDYLVNNKKEEIEEREYQKSIIKERKSSKKALIYGTIGLGIAVTDYYISNKLGVESLYKTFKEMNFHEIVANSLLGCSFISAFGGGVIYGMTYLFEEDLNKDKNDKIKNLEEDLKD